MFSSLPQKTGIFYLNCIYIYLYWFSFSQALFHKVIYHELLGHGSGKLFQMRNDGTLNYDPNTIDPLTGNAVGSDCYKANDTWSGKFQNLSNPYEECRADSVALFYSCFKEAYEVLQPEEVDNWESIRTCLFIEFIYAGIQGNLNNNISLPPPAQDSNYTMLNITNGGRLTPMVGGLYSRFYWKLDRK